MIVLAIAAVQVCLDGIFWQHPQLMWNNGIGTSALLEYLDGGTGRLSSLVPSIFEPVNGRTIALVAVAIAAVATLTLWLTAYAAPKPRSHEEHEVR